MARVLTGWSDDEKRGQEALIRRGAWIGGRSAHSFERLAIAHRDRLYRRALYLTRNVADAEDLVQDAYLRAYKHFDTFRRGTNFKAWMFQVLRNTFINQYRQSRSRGVTVDIGSVERQLEVTRNEDAIDAGIEMSGKAMRAALGRLPYESRMVFLLAYIAQFTYEEIAETMGCPIGTVISRLFRARRQLRSDLLEGTDCSSSALPATLVSEASGSASNPEGGCIPRPGWSGWMHPSRRHHRSKRRTFDAQL